MAILIITGGLGALAVLCLAFALWRRCGRKSKVQPETRCEKEEVCSQQDHKTVDVTPIEGKKIFGSYKQDDGSDALMMNLYHTFEKEGVDFWLDKMRGAERSEAGMVAGVKACDCFCAVISPKYFQSKFCLLELNTAIQNEKQIAICFNGSKHTVQVAINWIPEEFKHLLINEVIMLHEDHEFMKTSLEKLRLFVKTKTAALMNDEIKPGTDAKKAQTEGDLEVTEIMDSSQEASGA